MSCSKWYIDPKLLYNNDIGSTNFDFRNHVESYNIKNEIVYCNSITLWPFDKDDKIFV